MLLTLMVSPQVALTGGVRCLGGVRGGVDAGCVTLCSVGMG